MSGWWCDGTFHSRVRRNLRCVIRYLCCGAGGVEFGDVRSGDAGGAKGGLMSRLDQHVGRVQNKLALGRFINALAWATLIVSAAILVAIVIDKIIVLGLPARKVWIGIWSALGVASLGALAWAILRRPSRFAAAVAIDETLGLKEKFSTALYIRNSND